MKSQRIILTPAPGAVFLRLSGPSAEMTPGEALRVSAELRRCAEIAIGAEDGCAVRLMIGRQSA